jgi:hypothetical protein
MIPSQQFKLMESCNTFDYKGLCNIYAKFTANGGSQAIYGLMTGVQTLNSWIFTNFSQGTLALLTLLTTIDNPGARNDLEPTISNHQNPLNWTWIFGISPKGIHP